MSAAGTDRGDPLEELRRQLALLSQRIEALQSETSDADEPDDGPAEEELVPNEAMLHSEAPAQTTPQDGDQLPGEPAGPESADEDTAPPRDPAPPEVVPIAPPTRSRYSALHEKLAAMEAAERRASEEAAAEPRTHEEAHAAARPTNAETPGGDRAADGRPAAAARRARPDGARVPAEAPAPGLPDAVGARQRSTVVGHAATWTAAPDDDAAPRGVRFSDLPQRPARERTSGLIVPIVAVLALVAAAFAGGAWWAGRDAGGTTSPAAPQTGSPQTEDAALATDGAPETAPSVDERPASPSAPADSTAVPATTVAPEEESVTVAEPEAVIAAAVEALGRAGHSFVTPTYVNGTLVLEGVIPADALTDGYFSLVGDIEDVVAGIGGVQMVTPRLFLRGDDARLRAALASISEEQPIEFALGRADLGDASRAALAEAASAILANPGLRVLVAGHTDTSGSAELNADLAARRAAAVIQELVAQGVPIVRLQPVSYGELFPEADLSDAENRRVAFEVAP